LAKTYLKKLYSSTIERYIVQQMNKNNSDFFNLLRSIANNPDASQRNLAKNIGFSLGKLNYCLKALKQKGLIKVKNFKNNKNKQNYLYILTPKGISEKARLTVNFMNLKMKEYDELKKEVKKDVARSKN
tara:strand:+ start:4187 stop:4573 length:387 start_codon:yes stop_codon:yes gene_type:complete